MGDFSKINSSSAESFNKQKQLIKQLLTGKTILCDVCGKPLHASLPANPKKDPVGRIRCDKGCTDIELEMD